MYDRIIIKKLQRNETYLNFQRRIKILKFQIQTNQSLVEFRLSQRINQQIDKVDMTWMVQSDTKNSLQETTSEISKYKIKINTTSKKPYWPKI